MARAEVRRFLGVDGGGSKTAFVLIDERGTVLASHTEGPAYYLEIGIEELRAMLARGISTAASLAGLSASDISFAFLGLPAYGEDSRLLPVLDAIATPALPPGRFSCGNDMVCGWAGALAGEDGISVVAGTGSIAYGEYRGRVARAGGWGEIFGDEGSAYWIAREGLTLFARMSDGRTPRGPLHQLVRHHFAIDADLDLCAAIYGQSAAVRSRFAGLAKLIAQAADAGDAAARALFARAAQELAEIIIAVRRSLGVPAAEELPLSYSGGLFGRPELMLEPLRAALAASGEVYRLLEPRLAPAIGAALRAAMLSGAALDAGALAALKRR